MDKTSQSEFKRIVYVFQGGGALGAYQVGIFNALTENNYHPNWIIGTSVGAINASIIAGNPPEIRQEKLYEFWDAITQNTIPDYVNNHALLRRYYNALSAERSILWGDENFFHPRLDNPPWSKFDSTPDQISFYDTTPLKKLLSTVIDFDYINQRNVRLTLSAVEIKEGKTVYFDNHKTKITVDHVMASGALPPGFPAVEIGGKYYWDGGVLSNAPIRVLLQERLQTKTLCFVVHLFDSFGMLPQNLDDVLKRHKDISYSSHFRSHMDTFKLIHGLRFLLNQVAEHLPDEIKNDNYLKHSIYLHNKIAPFHFVRFLYEAPITELSSKDFEFSKLSMRERYTAGFQDAEQAIEQSPWLNITDEKLGISIHEFSRDIEKLELIKKSL